MFYFIFELQIVNSVISANLSDENILSLYYFVANFVASLSTNKL